MYWDSHLDDALKKRGYAQNHDKKEIIPSFQGQGSRAQSAWAFDNARFYGAKVVPEAVYLGAMHQCEGYTAPERERRLRAATNAYYALGSMWTKAPKRFAKIAFRAFVAVTAWSGLIAFVLAKGDEEALDTLLLKFGRRMQKGDACKKSQVSAVNADANTDAEIRYVAQARKETWRFLGIAGTGLELRIQRIRMWQTVSEDPMHHVQLIGAVFGTLQVGAKLEHIGAIGVPTEHANKHIMQFCGDLRDMCTLEDADELRGIVFKYGQCEPLKVLFDKECAELFRCVQVDVLRVCFLQRSFPPPKAYEVVATPGRVSLASFAGANKNLICSLDRGGAAWGPMHQSGHTQTSVTPATGASSAPQLPSDSELPYVCDKVGEGGSCGARFGSYKALALHVRTKHKAGNVQALVVITNQCPYCETVLASRASAVQHVRGAFKQGKCAVERAKWHHTIITPDDISCSICGLKFDDL